jgi:hypothetical protein
MFTKSTLVVLALSALIHAASTPLRVQSVFESVLFDDVKVPVVLGVRSRDTDTLLCQSVFDQVLKQVANKVEISFAYIAEIDRSDPDFGVSCENGPSECAANVQQLCVDKYAESPSQWWQFVMCQNYNGRDRIGESSLARQCIRSARIDWEGGVDECIGTDDSGPGEEGVELLQDNVRAAHDAEIYRSCTVVINDTPVCIHDGAWKGCEEGHSPSDFVRQINAEWRKINSLMALDE